MTNLCCYIDVLVLALAGAGELLVLLHLAHGFDMDIADDRRLLRFRNAPIILAMTQEGFCATQSV